MPEVADLWVKLRAETAPFTRGMGEAAVKGESFTKRMGGLGATMSKVGKATVVAGLGIAAVSVKMAADFQTQMTRLQTAAGLTTDKMKAIGLNSDSLNQKVLQLGSSVGFSGTKMAEALYHPISAGLNLKSALEVVKYSAEEAKISGASLEDTTYSLSSVMKAFNFPASQAKQTMASLNAIVGEGDMHFQDFNESVKNWAPTAAQMGISVNSMGAGLAYLTDRGNSAEVASTRLTMGISMMTTPSAKATKMLTALGLASTDVKASSAAMQKAMKTSGITQNKLAQDLKKPDGLYVALKDLKDGLEKAGVKGTEADSVLSKIFGGGRSDKAIMSLMQNLDGLKGKFGDIQKASNTKNFDAQWQKTQKTFSNQMDKLKASAENMGISLGLKLIPPLQKMFAFLQQHKGLVDALASVIGVVLAGSVLKFVSGALSPFKKGIVGASKGVADLIRGMSSAEAAASESTGKMGSLGGILRKVFSGVGKAFAATWRGLSKGASVAAKGVAKAFQAVPWRSIGSGISRGIGGAWSGIVKGAQGAGRAVGGLASSIGRVSKVAGKAAWTGVVEGLKGVGSAMKTAATFALDLSKKTLMSAASALRAAGAWAIEKVQLLATAAAEKLTAAAEWLLNIALDANPVVLIVLGIIALVAILVLAYNKIGWFRDFCNSAFKMIGQAIGWLVDWVKANWPLLLAILTGPIGIAVYLIVKYWNKIKSGFEDAYHATVNVGKQLVNWILGLPGRAQSALSSLASKIISVAVNAWTSFKTSTINKAQELLSWIKGIPGRVTSALGDLGRLLVHAGESIISGLINGIEGKLGDLGSMLGSVGSFIADHKGPPSYDKVMLTPAGQMIMQGLMDGINGHLPKLAKTTANVGATVESSFRERLGIASPSKVFRSLGIYLNEGLVDGLTGSTARVKSATRRIESLLMETYNRVSDLRGTRGVSNRWVNAHEATLRHLEYYAAREDRVMRSLAARRDSVAKRIKDAQKALAAVQKQWQTEVNDVAKGVMQGFSIVTQAPQEGFALSAADVVNHMQEQYQKAQEFAAELQTLQKKGLSATLIQQIASAGVDQGGATAAALAGATKGQIKQLNSLQSATQSAANGVGVAVADSMYGAGLKSAQGLVKGLQSQEKAIEKQMMRIAQSMQKAIKRALGIRSPSRVFEEIGTWVPKGLSKGVEGSAHHATAAVNRLAGQMASAGAHVGAGLGVAGAGGSTVVNQYTVNVTVQGSVRSDRDLRDVVEQQMLRLGMRNSTTYASYKR